MTAEHPDPTGQGKVAVVVVNWNAGETLARCLEALDRQSRRPEAVVVVDNGSEQAPMPALDGYFPGARLLVPGANLGFAAGNNLAIRALEDYEWIALVNPDAFPEPDWLASLLDAAGRRPEFSFFASRLVLADDPKRLDGAGDVYHASGLAWRRWHGQTRGVEAEAEEEVFSPCAAAALYRRSALDETGGFDESFFCYFEDIDLSFRLRLRGHRCLYVGGAVARHVGSASTGVGSDFAVYHGHRNLVWTYLKNMPGWLLWRYLPQHILLNILSIFMYSVRGKGRVILRAKRDALRGIRRALAQRRKIQRNSRVQPRDVQRAMATGWLRPYMRRYV
jgi:GT2 family glycosyltransferase